MSSPFGNFVLGKGLGPVFLDFVCMCLCVCVASLEVFWNCGII